MNALKRYKLALDLVDKLNDGWIFKEAELRRRVKKVDVSLLKNCTNERRWKVEKVCETCTKYRLRVETLSICFHPSRIRRKRDNERRTNPHGITENL